MADLGRLSSLERTAKLISALLSGRELTRAEITALLGVRIAAADRQLEAIGRHIPLVREKRRGRLHVRIDRSKVAGGAERIPIATTIAACVGASLARLFEGTNYEKGMHDLVQYVSRDAIHPERFQDSRRQFVFLVRGGEPGATVGSVRAQPPLASLAGVLHAGGSDPRPAAGEALPGSRQLGPGLRARGPRGRPAFVAATHRAPGPTDGEGAPAGVGQELGIGSGAERGNALGPSVRIVDQVLPCGRVLSPT